MLVLEGLLDLHNQPLKKNEISAFLLTCMVLDGIILSEISQRRTNNRMISLVYEILKQMNKNNKTETQP